MVRPEVIRKRLNKLDEYLGILNGLQGYTLEEFMGNPEHYGSAERFLHLAIEAINDMGNHVISEMELGVVNWYSDIPRLLGEREYISGELKERWVRMIGFRNTLVHEYIDIDRKIVFHVLHNNLKDLGELKKIFGQFL
jgi:uncharacterized protein YutE (UPF0331/DUF86 family)